MATPTTFPKVDTIFLKPVDMSDEQCSALPTCRVITQDPNYTLYCWKLTEEEIEEIKHTGRVWVGVVGRTIVPFFVTGKKPI